MNDVSDPSVLCEHGEYPSACIDCIGKPYVQPRKAPAPARATHSPRSADDVILPLSGTKDISVPVFKIGPYLDEQTNWLLAQGYPHDLRSGGWLYLRCDGGLRGRVRVLGMGWREDRPWRTGDDPDERGAGPGLVFTLAADTWEKVDIELGDSADSQRSGFRYLATTTSGEVAHLMANDPIPPGDWDPPFTMPLEAVAGLTINLPHPDEVTALRAISRLRESLTSAVTMADELEGALLARRISPDVLARHSKWCHTGGSFAAGMDPALDAARAIYGLVPERLLDSDGRPYPNYAALIAALKRRIEARSTP